MSPDASVDAGGAPVFRVRPAVAVFRVRPAVLSDAEAVAVIQAHTWQVAYRGKIPQSYLDALDPAGRRPAWERTIEQAKPPAGTLVLDHHTAGVVGFASVSPSRDTDTDPLTVGEVHAIYLLPAYWGRGAGRMLMDAALHRLTEAGYPEVILWVLGSNDRARRFYEAGGWRADGTEKVNDSRGFSVLEVRYRRRLPGG
jgi:ribosomal protein S18 acetylase RimI-like enzyme